MNNYFCRVPSVLTLKASDSGTKTFVPTYYFRTMPTENTGSVQNAEFPSRIAGCFLSMLKEWFDLANVTKHEHRQ